MFFRELCCCLLFLLGLGCCAGASAQDYVQRQAVLFYNCENLFSPDNNPLKNDDDFTPEGSRHWTSFRQYQKLVGLTKVIVDAGQGKAPSLIGLAEVENDSVMQRWVHQTALWPWHYQYVITHSDDVRGINVALMYQPLDFRLLGFEEVKVPLPASARPTRNLLHAWGTVVGGDTLDVVVCHLPSRLGGARASAPFRRAAHLKLRSLCDSLEGARVHPRVLVMGDMNDSPDTRLLRKDMNFGVGLHNLMDGLQRRLKRTRQSVGTHKFQGRWAIIDQFWTNDGLLPWVDSVQIVSFDYLLVEDVSHLGHRPRRSYYGFKYEGGFSDHLPILMHLSIPYK